MSEWLGQLRFGLIDRLRGTHVLSLYRKLMQQQFLDPEKLAQASREQLQATVESARKNSAFYRELPACDYAELPILTKLLIQQSPEAFRNVAYQGKRIGKKTSGSTGTPFRYETSVHAQSFLWAGILLAWSTAGYRLGDRVAFLAGSALFSSGWQRRVFYGLMNILTLSVNSMDDLRMAKYIRQLTSQRVRILYGYATALDGLAEYVLRQAEAPRFALRGVVTTAENLTPQARERIGRAFGCPVFNHYGCNDAGVSAFECEHHLGFHVITDRCHVEMLSDGRLVTTDFANDAQFFLRYETGDLVELDTTPCPCGRGYPRIARVMGRANDVVRDRRGRLFHAAYFTQLLQHEPGVQAYQVLFDDQHIRLLLDTTGAKIDRTRLEARISNDMDFAHYELRESGDFVVQANGKRRYVLKMERLPQ
ncbi:hypothetical protein N8I74_15055 [Chitiniphilus purpureus]|uniref:Phenylacetate--CoA ligase family protein n=1 Tax=Chitiniphilus purpureus TaxID=2981137 RepID=A0ABY6DK62_9NEIS|nr:AMP-binding protein [Chitiniphilus sp. CD1]UXY14628.1 hypothetical protein N8I74_15055 [Chitiniphilus sp. CD1]